MRNNHDVDTDVLLDRHLAEFRAEVILDGPSPAVIKTTVQMLHAAEMAKSRRAWVRLTGRRSFIERLVEMTFASKLAAAVMITVGGVIVFFIFSSFSSTGSSVLFADVIQKIKMAHTLTYRSTVTAAGSKIPITLKTQIEEPDRIRTEMPGGMISISVGHTVMVLDPASHTATKILVTGGSGTTQPAAAKNLAEMFRNLPKDSGVAVGEKKIDGVAATGFRVSLQQMTMTVWADSKSGQPIRVDATMATAKGDTLLVMDHVKVDSVLDDSLFSLDAPAGYTLTRQTMEMPKIGTARIETAVGDLLHGYADVSGGSFPANLTEWYPMIEAAKKDTTGPLSATKIGVLSARLLSIPGGYGYAGASAKLGERNKVVFWYRPDLKAQGYRALFADLHVSDITADQLPTTRPSQR